MLCGMASLWISLIWLLSARPNNPASAAREPPPGPKSGPMAHGYDYTPRPAGGYRKPNLEGLFDEQTPPLVIRHGLVSGPPPGEIRRKGRWPGATSPALAPVDRPPGQGTALRGEPATQEDR